MTDADRTLALDELLFPSPDDTGRSGALTFRCATCGHLEQHESPRVLRTLARRHVATHQEDVCRSDDSA